MITKVLIGVVAAAVLGWLGFAVALLVAGRCTDQVAVVRAPRLVADIIGLLRGLLADPALPNSARWRVVAAIAYNAQPFNVIPDFVPVIGFVDNIVVTAWALRSVLRLAGPDAINRHWPGSADGLALLLRLMRLPHRELSGENRVDIDRM